MKENKCQFGDYNTHNFEEGKVGNKKAFKCKDCGTVVIFGASNNYSFEPNNRTF